MAAKEDCLWENAVLAQQNGQPCPNIQHSPFQVEHHGVINKVVLYLETYNNASMQKQFAKT
jgi:hypothetical protein